jgi:hypothetical protein
MTTAATITATPGITIIMGIITITTVRRKTRTVPLAADGLGAVAGGVCHRGGEPGASALG